MQYNRLIDAAQNYATDETLQKTDCCGSRLLQKEMEPQYLVLIKERVLATDNKELKKQFEYRERRAEPFSC